MFEHAGVALDLSESSDVLSSCLPALRQYGTRKITLITVIPSGYPDSASTPDSGWHKEKLKVYKADVRRYGFEVDTRLVSGEYAYVPVEIIKAVKDCGADWLVIGNRGYSKMRELFLGSTATEVLQRADVPVFLINMQVTGEEDWADRTVYCMKSCEDSLKHILHPTDFSDIAGYAFGVINEYLMPRSEKLTLMHVSEGSKNNDGQAELQAKLESLKVQLSAENQPEVETVIREGPPVKKIINEVHEQGCTLIVMGSQGRGYISDLFLGGVSYQVARLSRIPVLLIPAARR